MAAGFIFLTIMATKYASPAGFCFRVSLLQSHLSKPLDSVPAGYTYKGKYATLHTNHISIQERWNKQLRKWGMLKLSFPEQALKYKAFASTTFAGLEPPSLIEESRLL